jgi:hypothetical protein
MMHGLTAVPVAAPQFIVHLTPDDKFIDLGYPLYEAVAPGTTRVVVPVGAGPLQYVRTTPRSGTSTEDFIALAHDPHCVGVVLHSLPSHWLPLLHRLPPSVPVAWRGWGYEYYGTGTGAAPHHLLAPLAPHGLLLPVTRAAVDRYHHPHQWELKRATRLLAARIVGRNRYLYVKHRLRLGLTGMLTDEQRAMQRIDFFAPVVPEEFAAARRLHPWFTPREAALPYDVAAKTADRPEPLPVVDRAGRSSSRAGLLVGNSATPEGNHLDVLELLARHRCFDRFEIVVPLSYGQGWYRDAVIERGRALLGDRFVPLVDFMPIDKYHQLLHSCTHAIMAHLRQQAAGNLQVLLMQGTRVALHPRNLLYTHARTRGHAVVSLEAVLTDPERFASPVDAPEPHDSHSKAPAAPWLPEQEVRETFLAMAAMHRRRSGTPRSVWR